MLACAAAAAPSPIRLHNRTLAPTFVYYESLASIQKTLLPSVLELGKGNPLLLWEFRGLFIETQTDSRTAPQICHH